MADLEYFKEMFFMIKWVYFETIPGGESIPKKGVSKIYKHSHEEDNVWCNDFVDCYMCDQDQILFGPLLTDGFKMWIKCIHEPQFREDTEEEIRYQPVFLTMKCKDETDVPYFKEILVKSPYKFITLDLFPWPESDLY